MVRLPTLEPGEVTPEQLDGSTSDDDLEAVSGWMKRPLADLSFMLALGPRARFQPHAEQMLASYPQFPKEKMRTGKIQRLLEGGESAFPVYVDADDGHDFVIEGRHRLVALWLTETPLIPVVEVRRRK